MRRPPAPRASARACRLASARACRLARGLVCMLHAFGFLHGCSGLGARRPRAQVRGCALAWTRLGRAPTPGDMGCVLVACAAPAQ